MMDIQEVVDASHWPEVDSQPLSLEDSWRLRVLSAQVYSIMKNRDVEHFERVIGFLEAIYRLLPRLVAPIKHMKIIFGLKTMVIMWMLKEGRGMVDTVFKIIQFFPSKLPQYQNQCSQHKMFLMTKNHLDFKTLAQTLAVDKDKLEDYIKNQIEEQYGEHYAQKIEDRLLHYLHELETVLPRDTYIDKILKKESPVTDEEKLLLEVITSDSTTIAATLQKLLHCDVASCRPISASRGAEMKSPQLQKAVLYARSSKALLRSHVIGGKDAAQNVSKGNHFLLEEDESNLGVLISDRGVKNVASVLDGEEGNASEETGKVGEEEESSEKEKEEISQISSKCSQEVASFPQFCSKHQRWVKSILQECPDEHSEGLLLQPNVSSSPALFQSSSSTSSSQDLTPSGLIPCPPKQQHPPSQTSIHLSTPAQTSEQGNPKDKLSSGPPGSAKGSCQMEPQSSSSKETLLPARLSPVVRLIDIASIRGICSTFKPHEVFPNHFTISGTKQAASTPSPQVLTSSQCPTSGNKESTFDQPETMAPANPLNTTYNVQTAPVSQHESASTRCQPSTVQSFSRFSNRSAEQLDPLTHNTTPLQSKTLPCSTVVSCTSNSDYLAVGSETSRVCRAQLRLSLQSQAVLLHSKLLQPYVSLTRLSLQECHQLTEERSLIRRVQSVERGSHNDNEKRRREEEEDADSSFDINKLYSSHSSSCDSEDAPDSDLDYKPCIRKKRRLLEYVTAVSLNHI
ncbi:hypothetical protein PAMP_019385 [Pampus punctatissimus]